MFIVHNAWLKDINVGDIILVNKGERVPADMILLRTSEPSGTCFIKTDQLDGETDWKLRVAVPATQSLATNQVRENLLYIKNSFQE